MIVLFVQVLNQVRNNEMDQEGMNYCTPVTCQILILQGKKDYHYLTTCTQ